VLTSPETPLKATPKILYEGSIPFFPLPIVILESAFLKNQFCFIPFKRKRYIKY